MECNIIIVCLHNDSVTLFCAKDDSEAGGAEAITRTNGGRGVGGLLSVNGIGVTEKPCWMFGWLDQTHYPRMDEKTHFLATNLQRLYLFVSFYWLLPNNVSNWALVQYLDLWVIIINAFKISASLTTTFWYFMLLQHFSSCLQLFHDVSRSKFTKSLAICAPRHSASPAEVSLEPRCQKHGWPGTMGRTLIHKPRKLWNNCVVWYSEVFPYVAMSPNCHHTTHRWNIESYMITVTSEFPFRIAKVRTISIPQLFPYFTQPKVWGHFFCAGFP